MRQLIADCAPAPGQDGWAQAVCAVCVSVLPGVDAAALTLRTEFRAQEMIGASDDWAAGLELAQYTLGEGPGVEAFGTGGPVLVPELGADQGRWPGFADAGLAAGVAAVFAVPLHLGGIRLGTLDLYRRRPGELPVDQVADAALLADLVTLALLEDTERAEREGVDGIRAAVSYEDVNVATGMLAAQLRISLEDAFARLRGHAFAVNRSVLEVAQDVLARRIPLDRLIDWAPTTERATAVRRMLRTCPTCRSDSPPRWPRSPRGWATTTTPTRCCGWSPGRAPTCWARSGPE
ncbi:MAG TPA: ANTAR domain-containing protein [Cryptosporangiaceae bacterium]|nr:ANTAR domain-containing protein [Cryptosporangiaceae bacterium]